MNELPNISLSIFPLFFFSVLLITLLHDTVLCFIAINLSHISVVLFELVQLLIQLVQHYAAYEYFIENCELSLNLSCNPNTVSDFLDSLNFRIHGQILLSFHHIASILQGRSLNSTKQANNFCKQYAHSLVVRDCFFKNKYCNSDSQSYEFLVLLRI